MADPLLTSLCTICRIQSPKYKCPRCGTRTCSLPCIKKHKKWSSCNGERDPTAYIPPAKLRTDAGIDHDYNFLTKIERSVEIAEKILRDEREILPQESNGPQRPNKRARLHKGRSRGRVTFEENSRRWDRNSLQRMQRLGIHVSSVPFGMTRSKENKSSWNKRTNTINWQMEWMFLEDATPKPTRIMHKILDQTPLYVGFANSLGYHRYQQMSDQERAEEKKVRKKQQMSRNDKSKIDGGAAGFGQDVESTSWAGQFLVMQNYATTAWGSSEQLLNEVDLTDEKREGDYQFFYQKPKKPLGEPEKLIPLEPTESLATILPGLEVVEFPTICVLPAGSPIPNGYVVESRPRPKEKTAPKKRKSSALVEYGIGSGEEDGEVDEGEGEGKGDGSSDADEEEGSEDGEVPDQEAMDDDTTSSSGSGSGSGSGSDMDTD